MKVLVINCGSSSLKYQLIDMADESVICKGNCERIAIEGSFIAHKANGKEFKYDVAFKDHTEAFAKVVELMTTGEGAVIKNKAEISAIGHRIVHGAELYKDSILITDEVIAGIESLSELAPLHNPAGVQGLRSAKQVFGEGVPNVAVFDTAFHATMPEKAYMYAIPYEFYEKYKVRRYGFHGTSHRFVSATAAAFLGKDKKDLKIVTCHLGNGSSITAVDGGRSVDTSMGFTPLAGIIMGTRSGDIDPSIVGLISEKTGMKATEVSDYLNKKAGFLGVSGLTSDTRDIEDAAAKGNHRAQLVLDLLVYQIQKYIGSYAAAMGGLDAIVFTGGIGENSSLVRGKVCENLAFLGVKIDAEKNKLRGLDVNDFSAADAKVKTLVVATNEELVIARDTKALVGNI